jgi:hypothetical protein
MYLIKTLLCTAALASIASTVLCAPIVLRDATEDLALRADVQTSRNIYARTSDDALMGMAEPLLVREQSSDLPHPKSKYCKIRVSDPCFSLCHTRFAADGLPKFSPLLRSDGKKGVALSSDRNIQKMNSPPSPQGPERLHTLQLLPATRPRNWRRRGR